MSTLLEAPVPLCYQHGPSLAMVYNDAFAELLGRKHPDAFSAPTREVVAEVWDRPNVGPAFLRVIEKGEGFLEDGVQLGLRRGRDSAREVDTGYYLRAGSPVRDSDGTVLGVLHVVLETTAGVERIHSVADLASALAVAVSVDDVCKVALLHALHALPAEEAMVCLPPGGVGSWRVTRRRADEQFSGAEERLPLVWTDLLGAEVELIEELLASGRAAGGQGLLVLPMAIDGREGAIVLRLGTASVGAETEMVLASAATLVGQALARAQIFDRERSNAETLQRAMLPQVLPQPASFTLAGQYEPVATGAVVGGDFYDAFFLQDGRLALLHRGCHGPRCRRRDGDGPDPGGSPGCRPLEPGTCLGDGGTGRPGRGAGRDVAGVGRVGRCPRSGGRVPGQWLRGRALRHDAVRPARSGDGEVVLASAGHCPPLSCRAVLEAAALTTGLAALTTALAALTTALTSRRAGRAWWISRSARRSGWAAHGWPTRSPWATGGCSWPTPTACWSDALGPWPAGGAAAQRARRIGAHECAPGLRGGAGGDGPRRGLRGRLRGPRRRPHVVGAPQRHAGRASRCRGGPSGPGRGRQHLEEWQVGAGAQFAVVTGLSELVTNAVLHAGTEARVTLELNGARLTVTVSDTGRRGAPRASLDIADAATRGRGCSLVRSVSDAFGSHPSANGSTVWFKVAVGIRNAALRPGQADAAGPCWYSSTTA